MAYVCRTIVLGYRRALSMADIWRIRRNDSCKTIVPKFEKEWRKELEKSHKTK